MALNKLHFFNPIAPRSEMLSGQGVRRARSFSAYMSREYKLLSDGRPSFCGHSNEKTDKSDFFEGAWGRAVTYYLSYL